MSDPVNHPAHYTHGPMEVIDIIEGFNLGFHLGNVVKYILRAERKGQQVQDLEKARWYLDREIQRLKKGGDGMAFSVKVLADSLAPCGKRLTTLECTYPRFIHSEVLTHRMLSRNSASSRAIPTEKLIQRVIDDPVIPLYIGSNQKGMQAGEELDEKKREAAVFRWLGVRDEAVSAARHLHELGVHKQVVNRLIEPWMWIVVIVSATEWDNFFGLRLHKDAEPHFQHLARMMKEAMDTSKPVGLGAGEWHLPLIQDEDRRSVFEIVTGREFKPALADLPHEHPALIDLWAGLDSRRVHDEVVDVLQKVSVGRCARVSYLTHDGRRDIKEDIALHDRLIAQEPLHASPAEHVAQALAEPTRVGNFVGWFQYRKTLPGEHIGGQMP
jgi:thymidylate synthase ThyX